jgi:hypothetical protein
MHKKITHLLKFISSIYTIMVLKVIVKINILQELTHP